MIISENPKFICFQPWKCGSTTLHSRLKLYDSDRYPQVDYYNEILGKTSNKHISLDDFLKLPESREDYMRFTFIRNPYDRFYSGFLQRRHRLRNSAPNFLNPSRVKLELDAIERGFDYFTEFYLDRLRCGLSVPKSLLQYVYDEAMPAVDFVGFLETFEESFKQICDGIGIRYVNDGIANVRYAEGSIDVATSYDAARYRYIDKFHPRSIDAVNTLFLNDFGYLGYRMLEPDALSHAGQRIRRTISPFSDAVMSKREGQILVFNRKKG